MVLYWGLWLNRCLNNAGPYFHGPQSSLSDPDLFQKCNWGNGMTSCVHAKERTLYLRVAYHRATVLHDTPSVALG